MINKKTLLFLLLTFAISWSSSLVIYKLGGLNAKISSIIILLIYMPSPAISTIIIQKILYKDSLRRVGLVYRDWKGKWFFITALIFTCILLISFLIIHIFGNTIRVPGIGFVQLNISRIKTLIGVENPIYYLFTNFSPSLLFFLMMLQGIIIGGIINIPFMIGEELGWRGFLLKETKKIGYIKSCIFIGFIWGVWHIPLVLMGLNYPKNRILGCFFMILFTISITPLFTYIRLKSKSILGSCVLHGMFNGSAGIFTIFVYNQNELLSSLAGVVGISSTILITTVILFKDRKFIDNFEDYFI